MRPKMNTVERIAENSKSSPRWFLSHRSRPSISPSAEMMTGLVSISLCILL